MRHQPKICNQKAAANLPVKQRQVCLELLEFKLKAVAEKKVLTKNARICRNAAMDASCPCILLNQANKNMQDQNNIMKKKKNDELKEKNEELEQELKKHQRNEAPASHKFSQQLRTTARNKGKHHAGAD